MLNIIVFFFVFISGFIFILEFFIVLLNNYIISINHNGVVFVVYSNHSRQLFTVNVNEVYLANAAVTDKGHRKFGYCLFAIRALDLPREKLHCYAELRTTFCIIEMHIPCAIPHRLHPSADNEDL